ncbi:MAG: NAD(P)H-dependent glycerol-3-phosphate dehydrogenase [Pseudomonadota bacterium]
MTSIVIAGAGAFGTSLAITLARAGRDATLVGRDPAFLRTRQSAYLPGVELPENLTLATELHLSTQDILLLCVPAQALSSFLKTHDLAPLAAIACCKGIDLKTGHGPTRLIRDHLDAPAAVLSGPSFAHDLAQGLPTALTLACENDELGELLQSRLSTDSLRLYRSTDPRGAELGGALKNVIAIACGIAIGAGLGESARAALMTRGFAEIQRFALAHGAQAETLAGLSGFGDLALTCSSPQSRNFAFGHALGAQCDPDATKTVEGRATAKAVVALAHAAGVDMPICAAVADLLDNTATLAQVLNQLLNRPLKKE